MKQLKEVNIREVLAVITVIIYFTVIPFVPLILFGFMASAPNEVTQINSKEEKQVDEIKYIGEEGKIGKLSLTVNSIGESNRISTVSGYAEYKPNSGKFAIVNVTIKNKGKKAESIMINEFNLLDKNGAEYVSGMIIDSDNKYLNVDTLNPNLDVTGNLAFEIPKESDVSDYKLVYNGFLESNIDNNEFVLLAPGGKKTPKMVDVEEPKKEEPEKKKEVDEVEEEPNDDSYNDDYYNDNYYDDYYDDDNYYDDYYDDDTNGGNGSTGGGGSFNNNPSGSYNYYNDLDGIH